MSDLADEFEGRISVVGINNESIFGDTKPGDVDQLNEFLDDNREGFRYTIYIDNDEGHAKESKFYQRRTIWNRKAQAWHSRRIEDST
jgi:hypothetical protein